MNGELMSKNLSVLFFVIFGILAFWSVIVQNTQWGIIYSNVFYLCLIFIAASYIPKLNEIFEYQPISSENIEFQILAGLLLGFALVGGLFIKFSLLSPLSIPNVQGILGILGFTAVSQIFVMSIVISEFEETLRSATLRPTIAEWLSHPQGVTAVLLIFGVVIYFLVEPFRVMGLGLVVLAVINFLQKGVLAKYIENEWARYFLAILISGVFFALLHLSAYASAGNAAVQYALMLNAFLYAVMADFINTYFKSTVPSRVAHTLNNAAVASVAVGVPVLFSFVVVGSHALIMYVIAKGEL